MKIEDLEKLNEMRKSGAISEEEYQQIKADLLKSVSHPEDETKLPMGLSASNYCSIMNFLLLLSCIGLVISIILWVIGKDKSEQVRQQGNYIINFYISCILYGLIAIPLIVITFGAGIIFYIALGICLLLFPIIGGLKSLNGTVWKYPLSIQFLK